MCVLILLSESERERERGKQEGRVDRDTTGKWFSLPFIDSWLCSKTTSNLSSYAMVLHT